jgi:hypothetical protein
MSEFPRTSIGGLSVPRMIIGTNWFLGFSHTSSAKDRFIQEYMTRERIAAVLDVFLGSGIDALLGARPSPPLVEGIRDAEEKAGRKITLISIPNLNVEGTPAARSENERTLDEYAALGASVIMPHQGTTDALIDRTTHTIRSMDAISKMIRERGMVPGLSSHMPEAVVYADESGLDVETYIQLYNALGFLMQVEVEWVHSIIHKAKKPVLTIKPMAAGRLTPFPALAFAWNTLRDCDMVAVGTMTPDEARELIELSASILERRLPDVKLQRTRSKESVEPKRR